MIGTVDSISLSYLGTPPSTLLKENFDGRFPHLLKRPHAMQKNKRQPFIVLVARLFRRVPVAMDGVTLGCDMIWVGRSWRADNGLYEHRRKKGGREPERGDRGHLKEHRPSTVSYHVLSAAGRPNRPSRSGWPGRGKFRRPEGIPVCETVPYLSTST